MSEQDPTSSGVGPFPNLGREICIEEASQWLRLELTNSGTVPVAPVTSGEAQPTIPSPTFAHLPVSGRYRGKSFGFDIHLRVDFDRYRPMMRISADVYKVFMSIVHYYGSFVVNSPTVNLTDSQVSIEGLGDFTWNALKPKIKVTIPLAPDDATPAAATMQFFSTSGKPGRAYSCSFESQYFRTIEYEQDYEQGVTLFNSYDTASLPSGGVGRVLSVVNSYAEAGIEFLTSPATNLVPTTAAGSNLTWSNSELHAAMMSHFSLWADQPQWKVWLFAAHQHDLGGGLYGIMFDQQGKHRQGCTTFDVGIGGTTPDKLRLQLYTYVHELGHCFNLLHSWQKSYAKPPIPDRPASLSWMNYPWNYPEGGANAFWSRFPFQFDDEEIVHLRHAFRSNIIPGGNNFSVGSALEAVQDSQAFAAPIDDQSGLQLVIEAPKSFAYGEPVVVEIKLRTRDGQNKTVSNALHPNLGFVQVGIVKPNGQIMTYRPLIEHCMEPESITLHSEFPTIYESAYIGFGKDGFYFDQVGVYRLRAIYSLLDGSQIVSNILNLRVRAPMTVEEETVAELFFGEDQGALLYLLGSDSKELKQGNKVFDIVLEEHADHPLAVYANLVKGINAGRSFKTITEDKRITVRRPKYDESISLLNEVVNRTEAGAGVDNITLNMTMRTMASTQLSSGASKEARSTMDRMISIFNKKGLKSHVMKLIREQAKDTLNHEP